MGKRELLLAAVFVVLGFVVYQFTAPAPDPSRPGWSVSGLVERMRREVRGNTAQAKVTNNQAIPVPATLKELRVQTMRGELTVVGEDRSDIQSELSVTSRGYDDAEAQKTAQATRLRLDQAGELLVINVDFPREGRQTASLVLKVPSRLGIRIDDKSGAMKVTNVASLIMGLGRGESTITDVAGQVQVQQRGNVITITNVGALRLTATAGTEARVAKVRGASTLSTNGGDIRGQELAGPIELEARNADVKLEKLEKTAGPIRVNATGGEVVLAGIQVETRIDGRQTEIRVDQTSAATLSIYNDGSDNVELTLPPNGFSIDAVATDGRLSIDGGLEKAGLKVTGSENNGPGGDTVRRESRVVGPVRGGGPMITLRAQRGDITLRSR